MMVKNGLADEQLVTLHQQSDRTESFDRLYERYVGTVYQQCLTMTKDSEAAQDFTQDIFIKVLGKLDAFEHRSRFSTWLHAITHHYCLDQLRLGKRLPSQPLCEALTANLADPDDAGGREDQLNRLQAVLAELTTHERNLLMLKYEQGLSVQTIARRYGLSVSAVKMRLKRSRDHLQMRYGQCTAE